MRDPSDGEEEGVEARGNVSEEGEGGEEASKKLSEGEEKKEEAGENVSEEGEGTEEAKKVVVL